MWKMKFPLGQLRRTLGSRACLDLLATLAAATSCSAWAVDTSDASRGSPPDAGARPPSVAADLTGARRAIAAAVLRINPGAPEISSIAPSSEIPGFYEVHIGGQLLYADPSGRYILEGQVIDTTTRTNVTAHHLDDAHRLPAGDLPARGAMLTYRSGNGSRRILVFADPDCGYCKRLEPELARLADASVYLVMIPVLGEASKTHARAIACATDPAAAWRDWLTQGRLPPLPADAGACRSGDAAIARNLDLAKQLGVPSTPTMYFEDGTRMRGAADASSIARRLSATPRDQTGVAGR
jgi:thiol:disulfide interchange protein DsbC